MTLWSDTRFSTRKAKGVQFKGDNKREYVEIDEQFSIHVVYSIIVKLASEQQKQLMAVEETKRIQAIEETKRCLAMEDTKRHGAREETKRQSINTVLTSTLPLEAIERLVVQLASMTIE